MGTGEPGAAPESTLPEKAAKSNAKAASDQSKALKQQDKATNDQKHKNSSGILRQPSRGGASCGPTPCLPSRR